MDLLSPKLPSAQGGRGPHQAELHLSPQEVVLLQHRCSTPVQWFCTCMTQTRKVQFVSRPVATQPRCTGIPGTYSAHQRASAVNEERRRLHVVDRCSIFCGVASARRKAVRIAFGRENTNYHWLDTLHHSLLEHGIVRWAASCLKIRTWDAENLVITH